MFETKQALLSASKNTSLGGKLALLLAHLLRWNTRKRASECHRYQGYFVPFRPELEYQHRLRLRAASYHRFLPHQAVLAIQEDSSKRDLLLSEKTLSEGLLGKHRIPHRSIPQGHHGQDLQVERNFELGLPEAGLIGRWMALGLEPG